MGSITQQLLRNLTDYRILDHGDQFPKNENFTREVTGGETLAFILILIYLLGFLYLIYDRYINHIIEDLTYLVELKADEVWQPIVYCSLNSFHYLILNIISMYVTQDDLGLNVILSSDSFNIFFIFGFIYINVLCYKRSADGAEIDNWLFMKDIVWYFFGVALLFVFLYLETFSWWMSFILLVYYFFFYLLQRNSDAIQNGLLRGLGIISEDDSFDAQNQYMFKKRRESISNLLEKEFIDEKDENLKQKINTSEATLLITYGSTNPKTQAFKQWYSYVYQIMYGIRNKHKSEQTQRSTYYANLWKQKDQLQSLQEIEEEDNYQIDDEEQEQDVEQEDDQEDDEEEGEEKKQGQGGDQEENEQEQGEEDNEDEADEQVESQQAEGAEKEKINDGNKNGDPQKKQSLQIKKKKEKSEIEEQQEQQEEEEDDQQVDQEEQKINQKKKKRTQKIPSQQINSVANKKRIDPKDRQKSTPQVPKGSNKNKFLQNRAKENNQNQLQHYEQQDVYNPDDEGDDKRSRDRLRNKINNTGDSKDLEKGPTSGAGGPLRTMSQAFSDQKGGTGGGNTFDDLEDDQIQPTLKMPDDCLGKISYFIFFPIHLIIYFLPNYHQNPSINKLIITALIDFTIVGLLIFGVVYCTLQIHLGTTIQTGIIGFLFIGPVLSSSFLVYNYKFAQTGRDNTDYIQAFMQIGIFKVGICVGFPMLLSCISGLTDYTIWKLEAGTAYLAGTYAVLLFLLMTITLLVQFQYSRGHGYAMIILWILYVIGAVVVLILFKSN